MWGIRINFSYIIIETKEQPLAEAIKSTTKFIDTQSQYAVFKDLLNMEKPWFNISFMLFQEQSSIWCFRLCVFLIAVGTSDADIAEAINLIVREKGGISVVADKKMGVLPLPIAGLMSDKDGYEVAKDYTQIDKFTKSQLNCPLKSPFMSLSFMALLVIPSLKLSDKGLFDGNTFQFTEIFE